MKPKVTTLLTHQQVAILEQMAADLLKRPATHAEALRVIVEAYAKQAGYEWPEGVGQWGGLRKGAFGNDPRE